MASAEASSVSTMGMRAWRERSPRHLPPRGGAAAEAAPSSAAAAEAVAAATAEGDRGPSKAPPPELPKDPPLTGDAAAATTRARLPIGRGRRRRGAAAEAAAARKGPRRSCIAPGFPPPSYNKGGLPPAWRTGRRGATAIRRHAIHNTPLDTETPTMAKCKRPSIVRYFIFPGALDLLANSIRCHQLSPPVKKCT